MHDQLFQWIKEAAEALRGVAKRTPMEPSKTFSTMTGSRVFLKLESLQTTGSFKIRGAFNKIRLLSDAERERGVVCSSAGNHAQGVAFSATHMGVPSTVFMPVFAPPSKVHATRGYGARVVLSGAIYDEAYAAAMEHVKAHGKTFVHPFDDIDVIAGQGTLGLEILEDLPDVDAIVVPVGGGGLVAGVAAAVRQVRPRTAIVGVEAHGAPAMRQSLLEGSVKPSAGVATIADGIAVKTPGQKPFEIIRELVDEVVTVGDEEIAHALYQLAQRAKMVVEPAAAVGLAALLTRKVCFPGKSVVAVVSGGNVDMSLYAQILERGLHTEGLRARVAVDVPDQPGRLHELLSILSSVRANVETISHDRFTTSVAVGHVRITIIFRTLGMDQVTEVLEELQKRNLRYELLQ